MTSAYHNTRVVMFTRTLPPLLSDTSEVSIINQSKPATLSKTTTRLTQRT